MSNTRSRKLTVVLAAGALTMFGAASALAAQEVPGGLPSVTPAGHGGEDGGGGDDGRGGGENPLCGTVLSATPLCSSGGQQPPGGGGGGGGGGGHPH